MRSFEGCKLLVAGCLLGQVSGAVLPTPVITPAPQSAETGHLHLENRQVDPISLAQVLLTALPLSLRLIAATNVPVVSSILWRDFLDDNKPEWFLNLPGDIQSYLIAEFGPETAWPTAAPSASDSKAPASVTVEPSATSLISEQPSSSALNPSITSSLPESLSIASSSTASSGDFSFGSTSQSITSQPSSSSLSRVRTLSSTPFPSATTNLEAPAVVDPGLSKTQKIGLGVGVPLALLALVALLFACCIWYRRRKRRHVNGNEPPSSPGFIPRFSFQDRGLDYENREHRAPLNPVFNSSSQNVGDTNWEDDDYEHTNAAALDRCDTFPPATAPPPMATQNHAPIMAPALFHTHSSNRARGTRLSYTSLHAVAEVSEPDEDMLESPILGRRQTRTGPRRPSLPTNSNVPSSPSSSTIKRKPVPNSPIESPAASIASRSLLRPPLAPAAGDSGSSSSGLAVSSISSNSGLSYESESPISPITRPAPRNPFAGEYDYLEDYGPEYSINGYLDHEDGAYGGHRSLDRYPEASPPRCSLKTEWPLRNVVGSGPKRNRSPMWDRVYER
ncbi:hypothetical protein J1614_004609 [Plenodomus biglobosus]|nr:hypothetical protein J1614_004609 [Plenodomus biglobosus]